MTLHRFFGTGPATHEGEIPLTAADIHHLRDVLRLVPGDEIIVADGTSAARVRITGVADAVTGVRMGEVAGPSLPRLTLVQGIAKGEKMDTIVRQATEIGVSRIVPLAAERSVVRLDADKASARVARWRRIALEAAKQSQRVDIPRVWEVVDLDGAGAALSGSRVVVCWEEAAAAPGVPETVRRLRTGPDDDIAIVIGPEGGLSADEVASFVSNGAVVASLGGTVLRTETAAVAACALAMDALAATGDGRG